MTHLFKHSTSKGCFLGKQTLLGERYLIRVQNSNEAHTKATIRKLEIVTSINEMKQEIKREITS